MNDENRAPLVQYDEPDEIAPRYVVEQKNSGGFLVVDIVGDRVAMFSEECVQTACEQCNSGTIDPDAFSWNPREPDPPRFTVEGLGGHWDIVDSKRPRRACCFGSEPLAREMCERLNTGWPDSGCVWTLIVSDPPDELDNPRQAERARKADGIVELVRKDLGMPDKAAPRFTVEAGDRGLAVVDHELERRAPFTNRAYAEQACGYLAKGQYTVDQYPTWHDIPPDPTEVAEEVPPACICKHSEPEIALETGSSLRGELGASGDAPNDAPISAATREILATIERSKAAAREGRGSTIEEILSETILEEAGRIVAGARQAAYDHPTPNHERIALLWNAYHEAKYGEENETLDAEDVVWMMIMVKMARDMFSPNRDNLTDVAGYVRCLERMRAKAGDEEYRP